MAMMTGCKKHSSSSCGTGRDRTADTRIFSPVLYLLSYLSKILSNMSKNKLYKNKKPELFGFGLSVFIATNFIIPINS